MLHELDEETIDFICKQQITFNQFAICLLIHKKNVATLLRINHEVSIIGDSRIPAGKDKDGKRIYKKEIVDLIERAFIINNFLDPEDKYALDNFIVTDKFTSAFPVETIMFEEFWSAYPKSIQVGGVEYPAKATDYDDLSSKYMKAIKGSKKKHREIIAKLEIHKETNPYAVMNIVNFVGSRHWENMSQQEKGKSKLV